MDAHLHPRRIRRALALALCAAATAARADSLTLRYAPSYTLTDARASDATGAHSSTESQQLGQRFQLNAEKLVLPTVDWTATGILDWNKAWTHDRAADVWSSSDSRRWSGSTRLDYGSDPFRVGVGYTRNQVDGYSVVSGRRTPSNGPVSENYSASAGWRPVDLPTLNLAVSHLDNHDATRSSIDQQTNTLVGTAAYDVGPHWQLQYTDQLTQTRDQIRGSDSLTQGHSGRVGWNDTFFDGRLSTFASYGLGFQSNRTTARGAAATRETSRLPAAGLSRVEVFPDTPQRDTLTANPALVDSDVSGGAQLDLGYGRTAAGDTAFRDAGAQFTDDRPEINTVYVSVDRPLPAAVVGAFTWTAYTGDDNLTWTAVPVTGVAFGVFLNRFEITLPRIRARYVKVVARPLAVGVTTDPQFAEILVTEAQFSLVEQLPGGTVTSSSLLSGTLNGGLRYVIAKEPNLTYDMAFLLGHHNHPLASRSSVQNTLALTRMLGTATQLQARVSRADALDEQTHHSGSNQWGAALTSEPLPVLGWNLNYSGAYATAPEGDDFSNGVSGGVHAELYQGVSSNVSSSYRLGTSRGRETQAANASTGLTITPHPAFTGTGTLTWFYANAWGGGVPAQSSRGGRLDGSVAFNPIPALYLGASGGMNLFGTAPSTQTSVTAGLSLFHGGGLSLRLGWTETNDTLTETRGRTGSAGLTVAIARGRSLSVTYGHTETRSPVARFDADSVQASLQIPAF